MKNKIFALSLCAMFLFVGFAQAAPVFTDVPADKAEAPAIEFMEALGIMQGVSEGQFAPEELLTRAQFAALSLELSGVAADGKLLPPAVLSMPPRGCINVHGSLLPQYRGAAPIQWAVLHGEKKTGVTIQQLSLIHI